MGQKGNHYQSSFLKQYGNQEARSQSLPDGFTEEKRINNVVNDGESKITQENEKSQLTSNDLWFKTWPERCDKVKNNENPTDSNINSSKVQDENSRSMPASRCDSSKNANNTKLSFNEAIQNISLAYSPITKQLHLVDISQNQHSNDITNNKINDIEDDNKFEQNGNDEVDFVRKLGHRRIQAGSFSSTTSVFSGLSDPSTSGSLLDPDERSISSFEENNLHNKKNTFSNFFTRNVFNWRNGDTNNSSVWKLFAKNTNDVPPINGVVSSTALIQHKRPANLPAKAKEEETRHENEYKAMIAAAKKRDTQNTVAKKKMEKLQLQQEEFLASATKHFVNQVLPNWDATKKSKKTQELWWHGLPSSVRGRIWYLAIGNELNITRQLYEICLSRAQTRLNSPEPFESSCNNDQESSMDVIQLDISRTFPNLCIFQEGGPYSEVLHSLLASYVCYRPDVGYVQGMSYIAAILILNMDQYEAFVCFANLLNQPLHLAAFTLNQTNIEAYYDAYNQLFNYNLPKLYSHFQMSGLTPDLYLLDWIYTIFAKAMPLDIACRVWDVFLRDGYEFIFKTALGILHLNQEVLLHLDFLHGAQFLTHLPDDMSSDLLFKSIQTVTIHMGKVTFSQIVEKCRILKCESVS